jgi:hypothetical protein
MSACVCVRVCVCLWMYVGVWVCMYVCPCGTYVSTCVRVSELECMCACVRACARVRVRGPKWCVCVSGAWCVRHARACACVWCEHRVWVRARACVRADGACRRHWLRKACHCSRARRSLFGSSGDGRQARLWAAVLPAAGSAGCGSGAKGLLPGGATPRRGWHATHEGSSVLGDQRLARRPSGESRCRPCAQSLPQTHTPCGPRLAARMH